VTRQHVQALVNALAREGWVEFADNPEHRRSRLVRLTDSGRAWLTEVAERENRFLSRLELDLSNEEVRAAAEILGAVGHAVANDAGAWQRGDEGPGRAR
jgi:DNA-binding MarR family transcriptional regulator